MQNNPEAFKRMDFAQAMDAAKAEALRSRPKPTWWQRLFRRG